MRYNTIAYNISFFCVVFAIRLSVSIVDAQKHIVHSTRTNSDFFFSLNLFHLIFSVVFGCFVFCFCFFYDKNVFVMQHIDTRGCQTKNEQIKMC